jgi:SPP1 family predicted phage head-tail adaptor
MKAGSLRKRLTFEAPTSNLDTFNQDSPTWTEVITVWGSVQPVRGQNLALTQADTIAQTATHKITVRWHPSLIGMNQYRIRLGQTYSFSTLTDDQFAGGVTGRALAVCGAGGPCVKL